MANPVWNKLKKDFKLIFTKASKTSTEKMLLPGIEDNGKLRPFNFNTSGRSGAEGKVENDFHKYWDFWLRNTYDSSSSFKNRYDRYKDCEFAYYNDPIFAMCNDLIADETVQVDSNEDYIEVFAKDSKTQKKIEEFLDNIGLTQTMIREVAWNLAIYGDAFFIMSVSASQGIKSVSPVTPFSVKQRLEFNLARASKEFMDRNGGMYQLITRQQSLQRLYKIYQNDSNDISEAYDNYLFGYELDGDIFVAPWNVLHFRRFSIGSEFWPYGRPPMIHAIAPYRQLSANMNLYTLARIASFPIKHFKVKTSDNMTEIEQWNTIDQARQEYHNLGIINTGKDEFSINDELWTPDGLLELTIEDPQIDVKSTEVLDFFQNRMLIATRIPKGYLPIGDDNSWGDSGKSLMQQSKIFGRYVYTNQQAIIEQIINLIRTHFIIIGEELDDNFEISMPFPVIEETRDRVSAQSDSIRLAADILQNLGTALGLERDEALPIDIVKDVFSTYSFLDITDIEEWIKVYQKNQEEKAKNSDEEDSEDNFGRYKNSVNWDLIMSNYSNKKKLTEQKLNQIKERYTNEFKRLFYFDTLSQNKKLQEGNKQGRHYVSSYRFPIVGYQADIYAVLKENRSKIDTLLQEKNDNPKKFNEEKEEMLRNLDINLSEMVKLTKKKKEEKPKKSLRTKIKIKDEKIV